MLKHPPRGQEAEKPQQVSPVAINPNPSPSESPECCEKLPAVLTSSQVSLKLLKTRTNKSPEVESEHERGHAARAGQERSVPTAGQSAGARAAPTPVRRPAYFAKVTPTSLCCVQVTLIRRTFGSARLKKKKLQATN